MKCVLIPQYIYRPWNITADLDGTKVFYYPVSNESVAPQDIYVPNHFLILRHKALGDEARLRILKMLAEHNHTLQELTERLDWGKSTIHHHLKILRSAQLAGITDGVYYLKKQTLQSLPREMELYFQQ